MTKLTLQPGTFTYNKDDDDLARTVPVAHILLDGKDFIRQIRTWTHDKHLSPLEPDILYDMLHHEWKDHSNVFLAGCDCGQPLCDPLYVHIEEKKYTMTWSRLSMLEDGINGRTKLDGRPRKTRGRPVFQWNFRHRLRNTSKFSQCIHIHKTNFLQFRY